MRALAVVLSIVAGMLASGIDAAHAQNEIFITNDGGNSVTVFQRTATGDPPLRVIAGAATGMNRPKGIAVDTVNGEIYVANFQANSVTVYSIGANGNVAPLRTLAGPTTTLASPYGVAVDPINNEIYVVNGTVFGNVTVYPRTANGDVAPLRTFSGFSAPADIALDLVNNEIAIVNSNGASVSIFARTGGPALRTIGGPATGIGAPLGVAIDTVNDEIVVANHTAISATVYARTANGNVPPLRTINLGIQPNGVAVDTANNEILLVSLNNAVVTYSRTATGAAPPLRALFSGAFASTIDIELTTGPGGGPTATTTALVSSLNPASVGQAVTLTATVIGNNPTGTVQFLDGGVNLGAPVALVSGTAILVTTALAQGAHSITAFYSGDDANSSSTSPSLGQAINAVVVPIAPSEIPTLSQWSVLLLALFVAWLGMARGHMRTAALRRSRRAR